MTEVEYVIANFAEKFESFRGKRIVLHGSRNYAEAIITNFMNSFQFVGIMTLDETDCDYFFGLKVLKEEDISALNIDLIILTERVKYAVEAFHAVRRICRKNHIALYNMYGLDEFLLHYEAETAAQLTLEQAKMLCSSYDVISFEVMDTVLYSSIFYESITARKIFCDLIRYLREQHKEIRFSLRKSFPADIQIKSLEKFALLCNKECELIYRDGEDLSFRKLKESNPEKKILYFGHGLVNEFILPRCYGIDTCRFVNVQNLDCMVPRKRVTKQRNFFLVNSKRSIKERIMLKKLISFDVFDTLLVRKTLYPQDVFYLVEKKAKVSGYDIKGYVSARINAEGHLPFCSIDQIYAWLGDCLNWNDELTYKMHALELETEQELLVPRAEVVELLRFAKEAGKQVILTSDMYIPEKDLSRILLEKGITGYEKLLVSCDVRKSKQTGLYEELFHFCSDPGKILHIGDNPVADGTECTALGIDSILIPSVLEMASFRGWEDSIRIASNLMERCLLGLVFSIIFRNPFQNPNLTELPVEKQIQRFGISVFATLVIGHMTWLIQKLRNNIFDGVLFFARDGWLSYNIYRRIQENLSLPKPIYFYANRHAAFLCCADTPQETEHVVAEVVKMTGLTAAEIMENVYQITKKDILPYKEQECVSDYIERHMDLIQKNAENARRGYTLYSRKCGMVADGTFAVVDGFAVGNTQNYLSRFLPFHMKGFYFGRYSAAPLNGGTEYYLQGNNVLLLQRFIELETFLSSPQPSQSGMSEKGVPFFHEERRSVEELRAVNSVFKMVHSFALEFLKLFYLEEQSISSQLIETIYASEDYYEAPFNLYDDWAGVPIKKREDEEKVE